MIFTFLVRLQTDHAFKAKKVAFRERECKESVQLTFTDLCEILNLDETQSRRQILEYAAMGAARGMASPVDMKRNFGWKSRKCEKS